MPASKPDVAVRTQGAGTLVVEASTAERALDEVTSRLGSDASIVAAEKVLRGGLAGFFARELVQLTARRPDAPGGTGSVRPDASVALRPDNPAGPFPVDGLLAHLSDNAVQEERSFSEVLRAQLTHAHTAATDATIATAQPPAPTLPPAPSAAAVAPKAAPPPPPQPPAPVAVTASPVVVPVGPAAQAVLAAAQAAPPVPALVVEASPPAAPSRMVRPLLPAPGTPQWSVTNLLRLGLPPLVVDAVRGIDPRDDLAWVHAIGSAVTTLCRPLPGGPDVLAGPRASRLGEALGLPVVAGGDQAPQTGAFAATVRDSSQARGWLAWSRGERWLHLVVGGDRWRGLLFDEPLAVSWVGEESLPQAVALAADLGLVLAHGLGDARGSTARRALPVEVALAVRALLPQR